MSKRKKDFEMMDYLNDILQMTADIRMFPLNKSMV